MLHKKKFGAHMSIFVRFMTVLLLLAAVLLLPTTQVEAGKFNRTLDIGSMAPDWKKLPATDGKSYARKDFKDAEVLVVAFTCNSCPYAVDYEDRLIALAKLAEKKNSKFKVIAINVNLVDEDRLPAMKQRSKEKKFNFPYLFDETQETAKQFGATFTPEFFVLNRDRKVVYMGALDDSTDAKKVKRRHVYEVIQATLSDKPVEVSETVAIGCGVRYQRKRRRRKKPAPVSAN